jgi:CTP:molybdopterin cytidylyltransferase MocA
VTTAVIPAAGLGSRLGREEPKALVELGGRSLLAHVLDAVAPSVDALVLVVRPGTEERFGAELARLGWSKPVTTVLQDDATGSADAVALGLGSVPGDEPCIVVWADQVRVSRRTVSRVAEALGHGHRGLVLPLVEIDEPYVWFVAEGAVLTVGRRRDGDVPPSRGRSDVGTFGMLAGAGLACIAEEGADGAASHRERDFVYVVPRLADRHGLWILDVDDAEEALGVNSPADLEDAQRALADTHR